MSCDARIRFDFDDEDGWLAWTGTHDGPPTGQCSDHQKTSLSECVVAVEKCMGQTMHWEPNVTRDGEIRGWLG